MLVALWSGDMHPTLHCPPRAAWASYCYAVLTCEGGFINYKVEAIDHDAVCNHFVAHVDHQHIPDNKVCVGDHLQTGRQWTSSACGVQGARPAASAECTFRALCGADIVLKEQAEPAPTTAAATAASGAQSTYGLQCCHNLVPTTGNACADIRS